MVVEEEDDDDEDAPPDDLFDREDDDGAAAAAFAETEAPELPPDGVEYDERHIARLNAQLKGVEFVDDGERWRVLKVSFDAEHEEPVCFYFDAKLGDKGTVDDCEYSAVDEVQQWIANHRRRLKAKAAREASGLSGAPPKKRRVISDDDFASFASSLDTEEAPRRKPSPPPAAPPPPAPAPPPRVRTVPKKKKDPLKESLKKITRVGASSSSIPKRAPAPRPQQRAVPRFKSDARKRPSAMDLMRATTPGQAPPPQMRAPPPRPVQRAAEPPPGWRQRGAPQNDRPWLAAGARGPSPMGRRP